jgi:3-hydroxybutyryl-CoA dehydrogenase
MEILVVGAPSHLEEVRLKFGHGHKYRLLGRQDAGAAGSGDVVFDFLVNENLPGLDIYETHPGRSIFVDTTMISLARLSENGLPDDAFGFCGMPTFVNREILEVSLRREDQREQLRKVCENLQTKFQMVADRVGLVTPRVICMIINEAYRTVEEGTATREDIDMAMKLGTNYPFGPFEWCERIGVKNVCRLLEAMYADTGDERYRVCPMLEKQK